MERVFVVRYEEGVCEVCIYSLGTELRLRLPCGFLGMKADEVIFVDGWGKLGNRVILRYYSFGRENDKFYEEVELYLANSGVEYEDMERSLGDILRKYDVERVEVRAYDVECVAERVERELPSSLKSLDRLPF